MSSSREFALDLQLGRDAFSFENINRIISQDSGMMFETEEDEPTDFSRIMPVVTRRPAANQSQASKRKHLPRVPGNREELFIELAMKLPARLKELAPRHLDAALLTSWCMYKRFLSNARFKFRRIFYAVLALPLAKEQEQKRELEQRQTPMEIYRETVQALELKKNQKDAEHEFWLVANYHAARKAWEARRMYHPYFGIDLADRELTKAKAGAKAQS